MTRHGSGISRRSFLRVGGGAALAAACTGVRSGFAQTGKTRPNLLLILTDQQHIDTIAHAGCGHIRTPSLDALARRGTRFVHSHSPNPLCSPARAAILTGRTASETGVHQNDIAIRRDMPNIGQWLSDQAGYETIYAGKWHLPATHTFFMPGFRVLTTAIGGQGNIGDTSTSRACEAYLRNRTSAAPFMLVASFMQPHDICEWLRLNARKMDRLPFEGIEDQLPPLPANFSFDEDEPEVISSRRMGNEGVKNNWEEWQWRYYIWSYYRHVEMVDAEVGRVLRALEDRGHAENTIVVFTSDHGEGTAHHQTTRKNSLYSEALNVPFIISCPGRIPEDRNDAQHLVTGMDIVPTICDYAGINAPPDMRGASLRGILEDPNQPFHDSCVCEVQSNDGRMVRTADFKFITYRDDPVCQLFDMRTDPGELRNLAGDAKHADTVAAHRKILSEWERRLDVPGGVPNPAAFIVS